MDRSTTSKVGTSADRQHGRTRTPNPDLEALTYVAAGAAVPDLYRMSPSDAARLANAARLIKSDPVGNPERFVAEAEALSGSVSPAILHRLRGFRDRGNALGAFVIRNVPTGVGDVCWPIPATPLDNTQALGSTTLLARAMSVLVSAVTNMVSYEAEGNGFLLQDMVPNPQLVRAQESQGSGVELEAHTEQAFSWLRPDYVFLGALRGDAQAKTYVMTAKKLIPFFSAAEVALLREPLWTTTIDSSFQPFVPDPDQVRGPWPILSGPVDDPVLLVDQDLQRGVTPEAEQLRRKLIQLYVTHRDHHVLQAGDVLMLDNNRAMHGRSRFAPRFDGTDRFIVRGFATRDLSKSAAARRPGYRQIRAEFS